jgi:large subunit ribosomal protein L1
MAPHGKKYKAAQQEVGSDEIFSLHNALAKIKHIAFGKFNESIDFDINLGIDPTKGEQVVRGSVILPYSVGQQARVIVFAKGDYADKAKEAGADYVGAEDLVEKIEDGWLDFDVAVATPDLMGLVSKLAKTLGPKGLLPNKKLGTITFDVVPVIADLKKGRTFFKNDKSGLVHFSIGHVSFDVEKLTENGIAFIKALMASKPSAAKGKFLKKITISSTMGPGIRVNPDEIV